MLNTKAAPTQVQGNSVEVTFSEQTKTAELYNGIVRVRLNSNGHVHYLDYNGMSLTGDGRFYFSYNDASDYHDLRPNSIKLGVQSPDIAEIIYTSTEGPLTIEHSFIMMRGVSGLYSYVVVKSEKQAVSVRQIRVAHRLNPSIFTYGYVSDNVQGPMVSPQELDNAKLIGDETYELSDGTIYTKYDWANYISDASVIGLMGDSVGVWIISASDEYINGGPMKQQLTVHATNTSPVLIKDFQSEHFGTSAQTFNPLEEKLYGPYFIYINSGADLDAMITDAKQKVHEEVELWPYPWMEHSLFPLERSTIRGKIHIENQSHSKGLMIVLAQPGESVYSQGKEYMFWAKTDENGDFIIHNVRLGEYTLYAFATCGQITDELHVDNISVSESEIELNTIEWSPGKNEHLLWQIGQADRKASEFNFGELPRKFGMWEDVPANLTFDVNSSVGSKDWYFAQTKPGTWTVQFDLQQQYSGEAVLTVAIAGAAFEPSIEVYINGSKRATLLFGHDSSVSRSANTSGKYETRPICFPASLLQKGENTIGFKLIGVDDWGGLMYDTIKLEAGTPVMSVADASGAIQIQSSLWRCISTATALASSLQILILAFFICRRYRNYLALPRQIIYEHNTRNHYQRPPLHRR